jgi:hypothetical protein
MLQKYEPRNGTGNYYLPFSGLSFEEDFREPEEPSDDRIVELPAAASAGDVRENRQVSEPRERFD